MLGRNKEIDLLFLCVCNQKHDAFNFGFVFSFLCNFYSFLKFPWILVYLISQNYLKKIFLFFLFVLFTFSESSRTLAYLFLRWPTVVLTSLIIYSFFLIKSGVSCYPLKLCSSCSTG